MSFRDRSTLSMIATSERQHGERVPKLNKYRTRILPIAALYGGNASGKSSFYKALEFSKNFVLYGSGLDMPIWIRPYLLDNENLAKPVRFTFEILTDDTVYVYEFAVSREAVQEEKLLLVTGSGEKVLFHRQLDSLMPNKELEKNDHLNYAFKGTRKNQLFLTNSVLQKVENYKPVFNWFKNLTLASPDSIFQPFDHVSDRTNPLYTDFNLLLNRLDTGINHVGTEEIKIESIPFPEGLRSKILESVPIGKSTTVCIEPLGDRLLVKNDGTNVTVSKLVAYHRNQSGSDVKFDLVDESDGSRRLIDLLPGFLDICRHNSKGVFIIDELDRSLHSLVTRDLIEQYLGFCTPDSRAQLLFTTHDLQLMDQTLMRRDEMWVTERSADGSSKLFSFSEFKDVRYDKDIRKSYLQGRLGGVPRIDISDNNAG